MVEPQTERERERKTTRTECRRREEYHVFGG